jgi:hypothetical protein
VGKRLGSMGIASALCHVASSNIHAPQVTRTLVRVERDLQHLDFVMIFRTMTSIEILKEAFTLPSKPQGTNAYGEYSYVFSQRSPFPYLIFKAKA